MGVGVGTDAEEAKGHRFLLFHSRELIEPHCSDRKNSYANGMFRRRWKWFGKIVSDEGFRLSYGHKSVTYCDDRGCFEFGFEDGFLFPTPHQVKGGEVLLRPSDVDEIVDRVVRGIRWSGLEVQVFRKAEPQ